LLLAYGALMPLRILEDIHFWKQQEKEHTLVIRQLIPHLEASYTEALQQWKQVFSQVEQSSRQWIEATIHTKQINQSLSSNVSELMQVSLQQSRQFTAFLHDMLAHSEAVQQQTLASVVIQHIIRESDYFIGIVFTVLSYHQQYTPHRSLGHVGFTQTGEGSWSGGVPEHDAGTSAGHDAGSSAGQGAVPIGKHTLPPLPYPYDALEPYIDETTMRLHHDKHHQSYVDGLNKAEIKLAEARKNKQFDLIKHWERELAFNGAGHYLHSIFWDIMSPAGGGKPAGALATQIQRDFGSFEAFKAHFSKAAEQVEGGGWAILVWGLKSRRLEILQAEKHQNLSQWDVIPLLVLDVWEHAYYLKYQNKRADYVNAWWNVVHWLNVSKRFTQVSKIYL